ncbi:hypothetical protein [Pseudomonas amygdali]|uniref:Uncharacterized protein n=1 Tax=Pseudomonas amygdali pv. lachrymans str. M301315 TaxID=629260 RepID=A0AAD0PWX0_PSEAV|nr:hypothetical protein [Pseudomonas amygdali]AXH60269.1 hypothetical protein PLA107_034345 [Pseudomonas amygdali pv. lachrymans str. M301315]RMT06226.1 hypothetical protein ALP54_04089 [Pseudomonas amygdali pv. lachrymans]
MHQAKPLEMPPEVFVEAVRLANLPGLAAKNYRDSIEYLTSWWNKTADPKYQGAYGFSLYVRFGEDWLSGNPEESWVSCSTWASNNKPAAMATMLGGDVGIFFEREAVDLSPYSFEAKAVDGSHGFSGGLPEGATGNEIQNDFSFEVLKIFPQRYPTAWSDIQNLIEVARG